MKKLVVFLCSCLALASASVAFGQNPNTKWGKPSQTEWSLQAWGEAPDAEAVVLNKTMNVTYKISRSFQSYSDVGVSELSMGNIENLGSNDNQNVLMTYEGKVRLKVLKEGGQKYANLDLVYFNMEDDAKMYDELVRTKVVVYSVNEKGKVKNRVIKPTTFTEGRVDKNYKVLHMLVPDVQVGDIIEYQYEISSSRVSFLYDWTFQEESVPVLYAKCDMDIPGFLQFNMSSPVHPFVKSKVEASSINGEQAAGSMQAPTKYPSNHYIIEGHDILPKSLDLQRKDASVDAAKVESKQPAQVLRALATLKNPNIAKPAPMPAGVSHLMMAK